MGSSDIDAAVERDMRRKATAGDDVPHDARHYGDRGECAVCGRPLNKPPQPEGPQFCGEHDMDDLRRIADRFDQRRREAQVERYRRL